MEQQTRKLEAQSFDPAAWSQIGGRLPELRRGQIIHFSVSENGIHLATEGAPRKADEKASYGASTLAGTPLQYLAVPGTKLVFIAGKGIAAQAAVLKDTIAALALGARQIVMKSGKDAADIVAAKINGDLDFVVAASPTGPYISLRSLGFTWVTYYDAIGAFVAGRADGHLYAMSLAKAEQGNFSIENWVRSQKACQSGGILRFPFRISRESRGAVPVMTEHGMETADITNLLQGQIRFVGETVRTESVNDVLAVTDEASVLVAPLASAGSAPLSHIVPRTNLRSAATTQIEA